MGEPGGDKVRGASWGAGEADCRGEVGPVELGAPAPRPTHPTQGDRLLLSRLPPIVSVV